MNPAELIQRLTAARDRFRAIRDCDAATSFSGHQAHHGGRELDELIAELQPSSLDQATGSAFQREYLAVPWTPSPEEKRLRELAEEYHRRTEAYDRTVCTGPIVRGGIVPATGQERSLINIHAWNLRDALGVKAAQLGFSPKQWQEAISNTAKEYVPNNY